MLFLVVMLVVGLVLALGGSPAKPKANLSTKPVKPHEEPPEEPKVFGIEQFRYGAPKNMKRSFQKYKPVTEDEREFIAARLEMELPCCPDCESGNFLEGPSGGGSVNVKCSNKDCGSLFNFMGIFGIDRNSEPSPDKPKEMITLGEYR